MLLFIKEKNYVNIDRVNSLTQGQTLYVIDKALK